MSGYRSLFVGAACCAALTLALPAPASACVPNPGRPPIHVSAGADGKPVVSPDSVHACVGETIRWVFTGSAGREFAVEFTGDEGSPFTWGRLTGTTVEGEIRGEALKGNAPTPYTYNVSFDSQTSDPKIIVDP